MKYLYILFCIISIQTLQAQGKQSDDRIVVITHAKKDAIQVRWAASSDIVWQLGIKYGYILERYTIAKDGKVIDKPKATIKKLSETPFKPMSENDMERLAENNDYIAIVKGAIYDDKLPQKNNSLGNILNAKNDNEMRFGFAQLAADLSIDAAKAHGLYYIDNDVLPNEKYAYRVSLVQQPKGLAIAAGVAVGATSEPNTYSPPRELAINIQNDVVSLRWLSALNKRMYSAYIVERAADGKNFVPINNGLPFTGQSTDRKQEYSIIKDSLPAQNNINYSYRIKGITAFGEYGPYSKIVGGKITPDLELPIIDSIGIIQGKGVYLHWLLAPPVQAIAKAIYVSRAKKVAGPYEDLNKKPLGKNTDTYIDEKPLQNNYYRIKLLTTDGRTLYAVPRLGQVTDSIAPATPIGLVGKIDSNGIVTLSWQKNTEADLLGYRVFTSNTADQDYIERANRIITKTTFKDTINIQTLSKKIFYKIVAVDKNYNPSAFSVPVQLQRPDKIAPVKANVTSVVMNDSLETITIHWIPSSSNDVAKQQLYRKKQGSVMEQQTLLLTDTTGKLTQYVDKHLPQGATYIYYVVTTDYNGNTATGASNQVFYETGYRKAIATLSAVYNATRNVVDVKWDKVTDAPVEYYLLYRAYNEYPFFSWIMVKDATSATDREIFNGDVLQYKIVTVYKSGVKTLMSDAVKVKIVK